MVIWFQRINTFKSIISECGSKVKEQIIDLTKDSLIDNKILYDKVKTFLIVFLPRMGQKKKGPSQICPYLIGAPQ